MMIRVSIVVALTMALAACESAPVRAITSLFQSSPGAASLRDGLRQYDEGAYVESAKNLNGAIAQGLSDAFDSLNHNFKILYLKFCLYLKKSARLQ